MTQVRYFFEALLLSLLLLIFRILPAKRASDLGGWIGRTIGPRLAASRKALRNVERALPGLSPERYAKIITGMWDNLGRVMAEYPHLETLARDHTDVIGGEMIKQSAQSDHATIVIGGHIGNWEINSVASLIQAGVAFDLSYRAPNNPWVDKILMRARTLGGRLKAYPKSRAGGRNMIDTVRGGGALGILIDQKYNEGIELPFFGRPAMTNPFFAQMGLKYNAAIFPVRCERLDGAQFRLTVYNAIKTEGRSVEEIMAEANTLLEDFIRERPEQWLWLHRRWKD